MQIMEHYKNKSKGITCLNICKSSLYLTYSEFVFLSEWTIPGNFKVRLLSYILATSKVISEHLLI